MFTKDNRVENLLTKMGLKWKYSNSNKFDQLVPTWETANQGRSQAKVDAIVLEYAARMEAGSAAPAPVLRDTPKGFDVIDGVQRLSAEKLIMESITFSAYIVFTDSELLALSFRIFANHLLAGHPESSEWTKRHAIQMLIIENNMSIEEIAKMGGWQKHDIEEERDAMVWGFAIRCAGGPEQLPKGILLNLNKHSEIDDLQVAPKPIIMFLHDLKNGKFTNGESKPYIEQFFDVDRNNRKRLYAQFSGNLEEFHDDPDVLARLEGRKRSHFASDINLRAVLRKALTICKKIDRDKITIPYMDEYYQLWNQVRDTLKSIESNKKLAKAK